MSDETKLAFDHPLLANKPYSLADVDEIERVRGKPYPRLRATLFHALMVLEATADEFKAVTANCDCTDETGIPCDNCMRCEGGLARIQEEIEAIDSTGKLARRSMREADLKSWLNGVRFGLLASMAGFFLLVVLTRFVMWCLS